MKDINFINNQKPNKEILNWIKVSLLLIVITICTMSIITVKQLLKISAIKQEIREYTYKKENLNDALKKKNNLKKQQKKLKKQYDAINKLKSTPKKSFALLENIYKVIPQNTTLKSISITKKNINLQVSCPDEKIANWLAKQISDFPQIKNLKLASITKSNNNGFIFDIKGKINKL